MSLPRRYAAAEKIAGACPIEAGFLGSLADHECAHGRLPTDGTPPCGCWAEEGSTVARPALRLVVGGAPAASSVDRGLESRMAA